MGFLDLSNDEMTFIDQLYKNEFQQVFYKIGFGEHSLQISASIHEIFEKNESAKSELYDFLERHFSCDFGEISTLVSRGFSEYQNDIDLNLQALKNHGEIVSSFQFFGQRIYVTTEQNWNSTNIFTASER